MTAVTRLGPGGYPIAALPADGGVTGTLAATEAQDTAIIAGAIVGTGTLAVTEISDTAALAGNVGSGVTLDPSKLRTPPHLKAK